MILQAILVGLVAGYGRIEQSWFGQQMIARPIWLCTLVGLLLGDLKQGVIIGGTLELIWAGVVQIGAAPTEVVSGSVLASGAGHHQRSDRRGRCRAGNPGRAAGQRYEYVYLVGELCRSVFLDEQSGGKL